MRLLESLGSGARQSWHYHRDITTVIGSIAIILFPTAFLIEEWMANPHPWTFWMRVLPTLVALPVALFHMLPARFKVQFYIYWVFALLVALPFNYSSVYVLNAVTGGGEFSSVWMLEMLFATILLVQLISHAKLAIILYLIGTALGCTLAIMMIPDVQWPLFYERVIVLAPIYLTTLVVFAAVNRNLFRAQQDELRAARSVSATIAHELRTPLASIRHLASGSNSHLPMLVDCYKRCVESGDVRYSLRDSQVDLLKEVNQRILGEVDGATVVIDMLLLNTLEKPVVSTEFELFSAVGVIEEALDRYPYASEKEASYVSKEFEDDFSILAPKELVTHVLFNLIKNSTRYVRKAGGGCIVVQTKRGRLNSIVVKDDGVGIPKSELGRVFDPFYTSERGGDGVGLGLHYCKFVMEALGGRIQCRSQKGAFTEIELSFPAS